MPSYRLFAIAIALAAALVFGLAGLLSVIDGGGLASKQPAPVVQSLAPTPNSPNDAGARTADPPAERR